jgi:putative peptide zinc metalloprotease protein
MLTLAVLTLPRILATAWAKLAQEQDAMAIAWGDGDPLQTTARLLTMLAVAIPALAVVVMLGRIVRQVSTAVWRRTAGRRAQRAFALATACALVAGLAWAWWPDDRTYRPIRPDEQGTLVDAWANVAARPAADLSPRFTAGDRGDLRAVWDTSQPIPTQARPQLALVLVPKGGATDAWVFPFTKPLAPGPGDNQALAVNTKDGTTEYDVAISLVWVTGGEAALNTNEAYAFASCTSCASVAVAFQVVLVVGDNHIAVPQNLAGALNSDCVNCLTYALAQQLFVTLGEPLSADAMASLDALWKKLAKFARDIESYPLSEIDDRLDEFAAQILAIIETDQPGTVPSPAATDASVSPSVEPSPTADASSAASPSDVASTPTGPETSSSPVDVPATTEPTATAPSATP